MAVSPMANKSSLSSMAAEALLAEGRSRPQAEQVLRSAYRTAVKLRAEPMRREVGLLAQRGRLDLQEQADVAAALEAPPSPAASLGLTQREAEVLALVAEGRTNRQIGQACSSPRRPPASTSHGSWPSWESPVAGRRPRSLTASASTSDDLRRPLPLFLGVAADGAGQSAASSVPSGWQRRPGHPAMLAARLAASTPAREVMCCTTAVQPSWASRKGAQWPANVLVREA